MEEYYSVVAYRVSTPWFGRKTFYIPKKSTRRSDGTMGNESIGSECSSETPEFVWTSIWGFDTEAEAWKVCDAHLWRSQAAEEMCSTSSRSRGDREDFHSDG